MKANWKVCSLGEIADVSAGNSAPQKKSLFENGSYPFVRTSDIGKIRFGSISDSADRLNDQGISGLRLVPKGSILLPKSGASTFLNHRVILDRDSYVSSHLATVKANQNLVLDRYLLYFLSTVKAQNIIQDHKYPSLKLSDIKNIFVSLPLIPEQKRIIAILDEAFTGVETAIANTEKNLANARELFESYLNKVFSKHGEEWKYMTLKSICLDYGRGKSKHRPRNDPVLYGGEYPFIQTGDVRHSDHLIKTYSTTYNDKGLAQSKLWPRGTICITIAANIAETGVLDFDACFPDSIIGLVVDQKRASNAYVEFLLQSVKTALKAKGKGSAQDNINLGTLEKERFPFPPLAIQKEIVENIQDLRLTMRSLESNYQEKLTALAELKLSLLQKAFSGELTEETDKEAEVAVA